MCSNDTWTARVAHDTKGAEAERHRERERETLSPKHDSLPFQKERPATRAQIAKHPASPDLLKN